MRARMIRNRYQLYVINVDKLRKDVTRYCERKGMYLKDFYESIGMASNILSNSLLNATRNSSGFDFTKYEYCENQGLMQKTYLHAICSAARLNTEDYICKEKEPVEKLNSIIAKDLVEGNYPGTKIDEIISAIEALGRIQIQNMEYLKEIKDGIDKLNEKWN